MDVRLKYLIVFTTVIVISMAIMILINFFTISLDKHQKKSFNAIFVVCALLGLLDLFAFLIENSGNGHLAIVDYIVNYLTFSLSPLYILLLQRTLYFNRKPSNIPVYAYIVYAVVLLILVATKQVFVVNPIDATYERRAGFYYWFIVNSVLAFVFLFISIVILNIRVNNKNPIFFLILFFVLVLGILMQMINPDIHTNFLLIAIISCIFYTYASAFKTQIDGLTGLYSHYAFLYLIERIKDGQYVFVLDLDGFKKCNDTLGHVEGDRVLVEVAKIIQNVFGKHGKIFRMGGDEFAVITKKGINPEHLKRLFNDQIIEKREDIHVGVSLGYELFTKYSDPKQIASEADKKMYQNKCENKRKRN